MDLKHPKETSPDLTSSGMVLMDLIENLPRPGDQKPSPIPNKTFWTHKKTNAGDIHNRIAFQRRRQPQKFYWN